MQAVAAILREQRRAQGISQARVAARIEAQQSQISRFEKGEPGILAPHKVEAFARLVGLDPAELTAARTAAEADSTPPCYCPDPACPGNLPFYLEGTVRIAPRFRPADQSYCRLCGETLESQCPQCDAGVEEGFHCGGCGHAYVALPESLARPDVSEPRVREIREGREALLRLEPDPGGPLRLVGSGRGA